MSQSTRTSKTAGRKTALPSRSKKSTSAASAASAKAGQPKKSLPGTAAIGEDAIAMLKADHKVVEGLFKRFEKAGDSAFGVKRRIVTDVIAELTRHAYIEETLFYPTARKAAPDTAEHVLESVEEHHVVVWMLSELADTDARDERFDAKMAVLMENVRHHVEEEEKEWFPLVRKAMNRTALRELGARMQAAKSDAPSDPLALRSAVA
ncbi:hemerythrin domain-containing protein [Catellatospora sichuanensis]|uniref:hemerythrin domain-containing protein n=1 Tax=Catellatospora sichuanensis TaxID=1969805 RepID=UPI001FECD3E2|nr:hemerythrin domain-containing protein [Catellatospora sichuanensis]